MKEKLKKFKRLLLGSGIIIPSGAEFYYNNKGEIGMKVGYFEHACHIESTNIIILVHSTPPGVIQIKDYWDTVDYIKKIE